MKKNKTKSLLLNIAIFLFTLTISAMDGCNGTKHTYVFTRQQSGNTQHNKKTEKTGNGYHNNDAETVKEESEENQKPIRNSNTPPIGSTSASPLHQKQDFSTLISAYENHVNSTKECLTESERMLKTIPDENKLNDFLSTLNAAKTTQNSLTDKAKEITDEDANTIQTLLTNAQNNLKSAEKNYTQAKQAVEDKKILIIKSF